MSVQDLTDLRSSGADVWATLPAAANDEPPWLARARRDAAGWIVEHGFPTKKDEDFRYDDLELVLGRPFSPIAETAPSCSRTAIAALLDDLGGPRLVFVNGRFDPLQSRCERRAGGASVIPLSWHLAAERGSLEQLWTPPGGHRHGFDALNVALATDGAVVELPEGAVLDAPVELVFVTAPGAGFAPSSCRNVVVASAGSSARIVETFLGLGDEIATTSTCTLVHLGAEARLEHVKIQDEPSGAVHLSSLQVLPGRAASLAARTLALGARLGRHEVRAELAVEGARVELDGLFLPRGEQCHDNPVLVEHVAPGCTSRQLYKGIVDGSARGVFNGHVVVRPGADRTDAQQTNKNLLLSARAEVDTRPRLEIFADDVVCTHGAAVGELDPDALFYLRSRGLSEPVARELLVAGFAAEVLERIAPAPLRARAESVLARHLAGPATGRPDRGVEVARRGGDT